MKMKKILLVISMLAVLFALAGCDNENPKPFDYEEDQIVVDTMTLFEQYENVSDEHADYYIENGTDFEKSAVKGIKQAETSDKVGAFEDFSKYTYGKADEAINLDGAEYKIENYSNFVAVTVTNRAENRNVDITVNYEENPNYYIEYDKLAAEINAESFEEQISTYYGWTIDEYLEASGYATVDQIIEETIQSNLVSMGIFRYVPTEMVVTAVYSKSELMVQAGSNTLIGMGTVFVVLIFISFIISLFKFLPALFAKKPKLEDVKKQTREAAKETAGAKTSTPSVVLENNLVNDAELVAVITAAIYAASQASGNAVSKDKLVVRSIRKVLK